MKGNYTFFRTDINHMGGVLLNYLKIGANPNAYVVLCGRFTPNQRQILQEKPLAECPKPLLIQE
eukprot:12735961-Ditylum_brightwellii.AAC.1